MEKIILNGESLTVIVTSLVSLITLFSSAYVSNSVFKNIDKIGSNDNLKRIITSRTLFNFYAIVMLVFIMLAKALSFLDTQLFIALFVIIMGGLGFKISFELLSNKANK